MLGLAVAPAAHADSATPAAGTATTTTTTPATPKPPVPRGTLRITPQQVNGREKAVLAGSTWKVHGVLSVYVPGQKVVIRMYHGGRKFLAREVAVRKAGSQGTFTATFRARRSGRIGVQAFHQATAEQGRIRSRPFHVQYVPLSVRAGQRGLAVRLLQRQLRAKHYVIGAYGVYDARTQRAVMAFRKMAGMARNFSASPDVFRALARGRGTFPVRYPGHGRHVEGDLTHQVLALIGTGGQVERLYMMSSGKPSTPTVLGNFRVYSKTPGTNDHGMVYSNYFIRGYAIHGYFDVPTYAASHGCLRVPIPDAISIYNWVRIGTPVDVYYR